MIHKEKNGRLIVNGGVHVGVEMLDLMMIAHGRSLDRWQPPSIRVYNVWTCENIEQFKQGREIVVSRHTFTNTNNKDSKNFELNKNDPCIAPWMTPLDDYAYANQILNVCASNVGLITSIRTIAGVKSQIKTLSSEAVTLIDVMLTDDNFKFVRFAVETDRRNSRLYFEHRISLL